MDISRAGRALAVVDAYEVMTAARSYKRPMSIAKARVELANSAGSHFDPAMVRAFLAISLPRLLWTTGPLAFLANLPFLTGLGSAARALPALATPTAAAAGVIAAAGVASAVPAAATTTPTPPPPLHTTMAGSTRATLVVSPSTRASAATPAVTGPVGRSASRPSAPPAATPSVLAAPKQPPRATAINPTPAAPASTAAQPTPSQGTSPTPVPSTTTPAPTPTQTQHQVVTFAHTPDGTAKRTREYFTFSSPDATRYAYSLDGAAWQYAVTATAGQLVTIHLPTVEPGTHTFRVRVAGPNDFALGPIASYRWTVATSS